MRISELAEHTGTSTATLKFYLREGLLHPGNVTSRTTATYDESHVARVKTIRALRDSAGLDLATVRRVLAVIDDPPGDRQGLLAAAQASTLPLTPEPGTGAAETLMDRLGWYVDPHGPLLAALDRQLELARRAGVVITDAQLERYARIIRRVADADVASVPHDVEGAVRQVTIGTLLTDPIMATLRRLAQQDTARPKA